MPHVTITFKQKCAHQNILFWENCMLFRKKELVVWYPICPSCSHSVCALEQA